MNIANFLILETLHQGKKFFVYRARKKDLNASYVLKTLGKKVPHHFNITQALKKEYEFLEKIDSEYVIKAVNWIDDKDYTVLVLEDINGTTIKDQLKNALFSFEHFIEIAVKVTNGVAAVHRQGIIHQDINPTNIILDAGTNRINIIDFDIASKFDLKISYLGNPERLQGTLPYISPEQTGRMNRRVDHRTDLYSLGVMFYEMLTGQLPFRHRNPMEIVYAHLARHPKPLHLINERVPEVLSKIILKLLAKNPEERYQSAEGLKYDLEKLSKPGLSEFEPGERDFSGKLQIPEKLYGREKEIQQLLRTYRQVSAGAKELILVAGYSGTGKTALVNEIHKPITRDRGYFISGKFDQLQRSIPYFAFIQALNQLCQFLLTEKQDILKQWKANILQAVGELGKILTEIIPQLESVIGKQPDVPEVGGEDAQKRFNYVIQRFLQTVSTEEHPMVIFIDDLQWADLASLNLLQVLMEDNQIRHLLIIGAYRDNEVSPSHPLMSGIKDIQKEYGEILTIHVDNLSLKHIGKWLQDTLKTASDREPVDLADLIYQKTQGNAFFTIQFLENLYKENLLNFDFNQSKWSWDLADIKKQNITDNIVELLVRKIKSLPVEVLELLKLAACIGNIFDLQTLSIISRKGKEELKRNLEVALAEHLIYPSDDEYFKFVHDSIHQAVYGLIAGEYEKTLHLKIGRLLLKSLEISRTLETAEEAEQHIFGIVNHINIGIDLLDSEIEKIELAALNLKAGQTAVTSAAFTIGMDYLHTAIRLLQGDCWERHYDLTLAVYNEAVKTSYSCGNLQEMDNFVETVLAFAREISHRSVAYEYRIMGLTVQNQEHQAVENILSIFDSLGVNIQESPGKLQTKTAFEKTHAMLTEKGIESIGKLPSMSNPRIKLVLRLYYIGSAVLGLAAPECLPFITNKMIDLILTYGIAPEAPFILALYGIIRANMGDFSAAYQIGKVALELLDKEDGYEAIKARSAFAVGAYLLGYKQHYKKACKLLIDNYPYALNVGDFEYTGYYLTTYIQFLTDTDTELHIIKEKGNNLMAQIKKLNLKHSLVSSMTAVKISYVSSLLGETSDPALLNLDHLSEMEKNLQGIIKVFYDIKVNIKTIILKYLFEEYNDILDNINAARENWKNIVLRPIYEQYFFHFFIPLAYLQLYTRTSNQSDQKMYLQSVRKSIKIIKKWADFGPINFLHKYYLMQAELYRVTGKARQAAEYYDKAVEKAYENEFINEAAIANELAAKFYMHNNRHKLAAIYFMDARDCYRKWGAVAKVKHLEKNYPKYLSMSIPGSTLDTGTISSATNTTDDFLDVKSIIKASQTLSGEVQLARLLKKMMQILVENAGAQKSLLIENIDDRLLIQAVGTADDVSGILKRQPVEESGNVPLSVINYVARSEKRLVFDNISKDPNYSSDDYIQKYQPKSVVCFPIIRKEKLSAIIYLENNLVEGAFTPERMNILNTLSSQIAISIENARIYRDLNELNKGLELKVAERTRELEDMDKAKSRFFANISHEFRTPLTLIMGPLEQILSNNPQKEMKAKAHLMLRNSQRLLNLINQLLELARLDSGKMKLEVSGQNIVPILKSIVMCFESLADQNNVGLFFHEKEENISLYFDPEKLEKIITNLLSNAFNYTPGGGEITVSVRKPPGSDRFPSGCVEISVRDTGTGIPQNQLPHIFDRFYRVEGSHEHKRKGSGIGLALTKELVDLHHGEIDVQSSCREDHNRGTEFFLRLPMGDDHLEPGEIVEIAAPERPLPVSKGLSPAYIDTVEDVEEDELPDEGTEPAAGEPRTEREEKSLVLVVDDNPDVRMYIKSALEPHSNVVEAADGKEGIRRAKEILPDLIVSDVMMPEIDGYELCRTLKNDILTSHIPILLLTARVSEESVLEGLETGADDYITKPFSTAVLTVRVRNLIELRRQLQLERKNRMTFQPEEIPVSPIDDEFYKKLQDTVERHLSDPDFNVEALSRELQMSQATLWRKINALTGKTPTLFIRIYRLKRAAQLLSARAGSVSLVAVKAGFSDPSYFAKCFKEQFNRLPSDPAVRGASLHGPGDRVSSSDFPEPGLYNREPQHGAAPESPGPGKEVILVVEDSEDARNYIRESLETDYRVVEAVDGGEGIARALEIIPDLIVSDVMMPGTDGYELCGALKKDVRTCHIPIVLLTARATEESMIRGLETGADDYVTKPFNTNILRARINNLIGLRRFLQTKRNREMTLLPVRASESKIDEKFMKEVDAVIAKNLSEPEFNVDQLAKKLYMSSATLYRKIQALTGEVPSEYIRSFRLRRAARLFKNNFGSVTEVAFEVGFNSRTYFTRCFKEKFHQLPSVFMASESR